MSALWHDSAYRSMTPEEQDALFDHDALIAVRDRRAEHCDEKAARAALYPRSGRVENVRPRCARDLAGSGSLPAKDLSSALLSRTDRQQSFNEGEDA